MTKADWAFIHDYIALGHQHGFHMRGGGGEYDIVMTARYGHQLCGEIAYRHLTPKHIDDEWWALPPDEGKYITKAAITDLCPQYLPTEYW